MGIHHIAGKKRKLNWHPSREDHRDKMFASELAKLLPDCSLRKYCPPVEDQGSEGSCTAQASTSAMEFLSAKQKQISPAPPMSRQFLYYATRVLVEKGDPLDDSGAQIRDVMKALAKYGTCLEKTWAYSEAFSSKPNAAAFAEALNHQILAYYRHGSIYQIKQSIVAGYPVIGGFSVPESMMSDETAKTGIVKVPGATEGFAGGHAILFVGYDDKTGCLCFQNSWGTGWGDGGYGYLPYYYINSGLASDCWSIRREEV